MISFVIPAFNEEALIGRTLDAVAGAAGAVGEPYEVVVVDDGSTDRTAEIACGRGARVISVRNRQIAATRNAGARAADGELIIFVDADTIVNAGVVRAAIEVVRAGAVGGGCAFRFDGHVPLYGRMIGTAARGLYRAFHLASGCFLFCTREAFETVGGFDESLFAAEEAALSRALAKRGRFVVLREAVTTSGRKLRAHSGREVLGLLARLVLSGPRALRRREGLDLWYGERRRDPGATVWSAWGDRWR